MADPRELFSTLNAGSGVGVPLDRAIDATTAAAALNGSVGFSFKNAAGAVVLPQLDSLGRVPTSSIAGTPKWSKGELAAGSLTAADVTGASITLTVNKVYTNVMCNVSCRQSALFQVVWNNNGVETVIDEVVTGPGQYTVPVDLQYNTITAGATGTQTLRIVAKNFDTLSSLRATLTALEVA